VAQPFKKDISLKHKTPSLYSEKWGSTSSHGPLFVKGWSNYFGILWVHLKVK